MTIVTKEPTKRVGVNEAVLVANMAAAKVVEAWEARLAAPEGAIAWGAYDAAEDAWYDANAAWDALKEAWDAWDAADAANTASRYAVERFARRIRAMEPR
jgi:hypothetical protein